MPPTDPAAPTAPTALTAPAAPAASPGGRAAGDLIAQLTDGRASVRAAALRGLAALGHNGGELVPFLRDGDAEVARAAADALAQLGPAQRAHLVAIAAALDGARREVRDTIETMFAALIGPADAELVAVLDTREAVAVTTIVRACDRRGPQGLYLLQAAARDPRARVRINALGGVALLAELDAGSSLEVLRAVAVEDRAADVRAAAQRAVVTMTRRLADAVAARHKARGPDAAAVPDLEQRALSPAELAHAAGVAPLEELLRALAHPRVDARLNAVRVLALQGTRAAPSASALAGRLRDADATLRAEAARALGVLGAQAIGTAPALVAALGDEDPAVLATVETTLASLGPAVAPALVEGLDAAREPHGARVAALIGRLEDGPRLLREALASLSVDVRVNAALGLGSLGPARAGAGRQALLMTPTGGNARVRAALATAVARLDPRPALAAPRIDIDGFESRVLTDEQLGAGEAALQAAGVAGLRAHLADVRAPVRANATLALGALGSEALAATEALVAGLRDDAPEVRLAAARALDRLGEPAVAAAAHALVAALRGASAPLEAQLTSILRTRATPTIDAALARGLDAADPAHAAQVCGLVCARPAALEILSSAFARPGAQATAARGLVMLGPDRLGAGRAVLERARTSTSPETRAIAHAALRAIDGVPAGPEVPAVAGFETTLLAPRAFPAPAALELEGLLAFLRDGRAVVRANAVTALATLGTRAADHATTVAALLRDDDAQVRIAAARALDALGDAAVIMAAHALVAALGGDANVADVCRGVLAPRTTVVEAALISGLETADEVHGLRVVELLCLLPDARELLFIAFDGEAQNVQINAALGIGVLGAKRAGPEGRRRLVARLAGPPTRRRHAVVKALAMLDAPPSAG